MSPSWDIFAGCEGSMTTSVWIGGHMSCHEVLMRPLILSSLSAPSIILESSPHGGSGLSTGQVFVFILCGLNLIPIQ